MTESLFRGWATFALRTPLAPVNARAVTAQSSPDAGRAAYLELLAGIGPRPDLHDALAIATPQLTRVLDKVSAGLEAQISTPQLRRAAFALLRYDIRSRTRPTPFGLFAGVVFGRFDTSAKVEWTGEPITHTHLDMDWLLGVAHRLENLPEVLPRLRVSANHSLTVRGSRICWDTPANLGVPSGGRGRSDVSVRLTPAVAHVLRAASQPTPYGELVDQLTGAFPTASPSAATRLLDTLVREELLLTELRPTLDGSDPLEHLIAVLDRVGQHTPLDPVAAGLLTALHELATLRQRADRGPAADRVTARAALTTAAQQLAPYPTPLHIEAGVDARIHLPEAVRADVERAADLLWRLSPPRLGMRPLRAWHEKFLDRYGVGRLVPLLEALDPTTGIGAPAGYTWPRSEAPAPATDSAADPARDRLLTALLTEAVRDGRREVELDELTLARLASPGSDPVDLPASCELYLHLTSASVDDLSSGRFQLTIAPNPGSHQAGATLARFAGLNPDSAGDLAAALRQTPVAVDGARPVNLAYQPHAARAANIAHTPAYTGERISVGLGPSPAVEEMPLPHVGIGATLERLFAVDLRTGQEITPMAHNMLSPAVQAPNAARLLWEIGHEGQRLWEPWDWGVASASPFLPRVRSGRLVLLPATWKVDALRDADRADSSEAGWAKALASWRTSWRLPQRVLALSSDQRLLLDLDDVWHQQLLREEVRKDPALVVQEPPGGDAADERPAPARTCRGPPRYRGPANSRPAAKRRTLALPADVRRARPPRRPVASPSATTAERCCRRWRGPLVLPALLRSGRPAPALAVARPRRAAVGGHPDRAGATHSLAGAGAHRPMAHRRLRPGTRAIRRTRSAAGRRARLRRRQRRRPRPAQPGRHSRRTRPGHPRSHLSHLPVRSLRAPCPREVGTRSRGRGSRGRVAVHHG